MLWKPPTPIYPKLIEKAPAGLTDEEANQLRKLGRKLPPICRLGMNLEVEICNSKRLIRNASLKIIAVDLSRWIPKP